MKITPADAALAEGFAGEMETAVYSTEHAGQAATDREVSAAFDAWFSDDGASPSAIQRNSAGDYLLMSAYSAWNAWQACAAWNVAELASLRASRDALVRAAEGVIAHMEGRQPIRGWLRDNDSSRDALSALIAALAAAKEQQS